MHRCQWIPIFDRSLQYIVNILIVYIVAVLVIGLGRTVFTIRDLLSWGPIGGAFTGVVAEILNFLVIIELFRSFIDYFKDHRIRLHSMMDPAIVIVIREMILGLYRQHSTSASTMAGFSLLILALGIVRTLAIRFSPGDSEETQQSSS
ncbi:MAG: phosphate-starvation-inducible PsiE family protein [Pedobacter sp.]|jgi:uncharacterized membrane protein (DUF373 family)